MTPIGINWAAVWTDGVWDQVWRQTALDPVDGSALFLTFPWLWGRFGVR